MAEEEKAEADEGAKEGVEDSGGGKKKLIIIAAIAVLVVVGGGAAAMFLLSGGEKTEAPAPVVEHAPVEGATETSSEEAKHDGEEKKDEHAAEKAPTAEGEVKKDGAAPAPQKEEDLGIEFGDTYPMKTFNLNLGNALENRFVRLEVTLEYNGGEKQKKEIEKRLPQLRDAVIAVVSRKTREFLLSPDGKDALRKEVLIRINRYMKTKIESVYITDILIE